VNRVPSQIRHDYKTMQGETLARPHPIRWFSFGLAVPLTALFLALSLSPEAETTQELPLSSAVNTRLVLAASSPVDPEPVTPSAVLSDIGLSDKDNLDNRLTGINPGTNPGTDRVIISVPDILSTNALQPATGSNLAVPGPELFRTGGEHILLTVRSGDSLDRLFKRHGVDRGDLAMIMRLPKAKTNLRIIRPGDEISITHIDGDVQALHRRIDETSSLMVTRNTNGFAAELIDHPIERRVTYAHGSIKSSLFEAGKEAGVSDRVIMDLAGIYAWDIDFVLDIRSGDEFVVVFEEIWQDGQRLRDGSIVAAEFTNSGKSYRAVRYVDPAGKTDYYTPDGHSMRKAFIRAPVDFSRISSSFNPRRRHPIFKTIRPHRGVDYVAPAGTPIKAAGDGKVIHRGRKGGYGNAVILQHGGNITTLYGHMSRFSKKARLGSRVRQGDVIGYVGKTGYATGHHLHYEYRLSGVHRNPRTVKLPQVAPIPKQHRDDFFTNTSPLLSQLDDVKRSRVAMAATP
jgi:murein DD-endopeptidase MepM/ murein hydrolase activator NlpD